VKHLAERISDLQAQLDLRLKEGRLDRGLLVLLGAPLPAGGCVMRRHGFRVAPAAPCADDHAFLFLVALPPFGQLARSRWPRRATRGPPVLCPAQCWRAAVVGAEHGPGPLHLAGRTLLYVEVVTVIVEELAVQRAAVVVGGLGRGSLASFVVPARPELADYEPVASSIGRMNLIDVNMVSFAPPSLSSSQRHTGWRRQDWRCARSLRRLRGLLRWVARSICVDKSVKVYDDLCSSAGSCGTDAPKVPARLPSVCMLTHPKAPRGRGP
jgi:hypothetical protein